MSRYTYERPFILEGGSIVCTVTIRHGETASDQNARARRIIRALDLADALDGVVVPMVIRGPFAAHMDEVRDSIDVLATIAAGDLSNYDAELAADYIASILNAVAAYKAGE